MMFPFCFAEKNVLFLENKDLSILYVFFVKSRIMFDVSAFKELLKSYYV